MERYSQMTVDSDIGSSFGEIRVDPECRLSPEMDLCIEVQVPFCSRKFPAVIVALVRIRHGEIFRDHRCSCGDGKKGH